MSICGSFCSGANTPTVGRSPEWAIASSVPTYAMKIDGSLYIWAFGWVKPVAGPPERIVTSTPVYSPEAMRGPVTDFSSLSIV